MLEKHWRKTSWNKAININVFFVILTKTLHTAKGYFLFKWKSYYYFLYLPNILNK